MTKTMMPEVGGDGDAVMWSLRRRGTMHAGMLAAFLSRRRTLWRPWIIANPGVHGLVLAILASRLGRAHSTTALLRRAAALARPPLALVAAAVATAVTLVAAIIAGHVWVVCTSRGGCGSESTAPAGAGATRPGDGEEGGASDRLLIVGEMELLEFKHVMGSDECGKHSGVGNVVGGVREARIDATQKGEDEMRVLHRTADAEKSGSLGAEMVLLPCTMEWNSLRRKMVRGSRLARNIPSMVTHRLRAVGSALSMARPRTESSKEPEIQPRTQHFAASH